MDFTGIDKLSLLDYDDKVSVVLFYNKCNFRCPFCHNGMLLESNDHLIPWNDIISYLKSRIGLVDAVVFSGGEVTLMDDLKEKIKEVKSLGFLVKLDTNGTNPDLLYDLLKEKLIDYVAMDIKNDLSTYAKTCGMLLVNDYFIRKSISIIENSGVDYEYRTTLVEEFHNNLNIEEFASLVKGAKRLYLQKFVDREGCLQSGLHPINEEKAKKIQSELAKYVKEVHLRGY